RWGMDTVRVVVAGELPREPHNAPLHLFSASPELARYGSGTYRLRSEQTSVLITQLFATFKKEGFAVPYTMEDFKRDYVIEHFPEPTPEEQEKAVKSVPPKTLLKSVPAERILATLSEKQIREYLDRLSAKRPAPTRKPRRKK